LSAGRFQRRDPVRPGREAGQRACSAWPPSGALATANHARPQPSAAACRRATWTLLSIVALLLGGIAEVQAQQGGGGSEAVASSDSPVRLFDPTFRPADGVRDHLEPGGAWAGRGLSATGDGLSFVIEADPSGPGVDLGRLRLELTAPADVRLVEPLTAAAGSTCGQLDESSFDVVPADDGRKWRAHSPDGGAMPAGCRLTVALGVAARRGAGNGDGAVELLVRDGRSGAVLAQDGVAVPVRAATPVLEVSRLTPYVVPGDPAIWAVRIANIGDGGLIDGSIGISALGSAFTLRATDTVAAPVPVPPAIDNATGRIAIPYLPAGGTAEFRIEAVSAAIGAVAGTCGEPTAEFALTHAGGADPITVEADIDLMTDEPDLRVVAPAPSLRAGEGAFLVRNVGLGVARSIAVDAFWPAGATVTVDSPDWTYQEHQSGGRFAFTGGVIRPSERQEVRFRATWPTGAASEGPSVLWRTAYRNACGAIRHGPGVAAPLLAAAGEAGGRLSLEIEPTAESGNVAGDSAQELAVSQAADYRLVLRAPDPAALPGDMIEVREPIPDLDEAAPSGPFGTVQRIRATQRPNVPGATVNCTGRCQGGDMLVWRIPKSEIDGPVAVDVALRTQPNACLAGLTYGQRATAMLLRRDGAPAGGPVAEAVLDRRMENGNVGPDALSQSFEVAPTGDGHLSVEARYDFPGSMIAVWDTTRFEDDFGRRDLFPQGVGAVGENALPALVAGSLTVSVDGRRDTAVPATAVTDGGGSACDPGVPGSCRGGLVVDLGFLSDEGFVGSERVAGTDGTGTSVTLRYEVRPGTGAGGGSDRKAYQRATLDLADPAAEGGCHSVDPGRTQFVQGAFVDLLARPAAMSLSVPPSVGLCRPFPVTVSASPEQSLSALSLRFPSQGPFRFEAAGVGSGTLAGLAPVDSDGALAVSGGPVGAGVGSYTATALLVSPSSSRPDDPATLAPLTVEATITDSDGTNHAVNLSQNLPAIQSATPTVSVGPSTLNIDGTMAAQWTVVVGNVGAGAAGPVRVEVAIPEGLTVTDGDLAAMDTENANLLGDHGVEADWLASEDGGGGRLTWRLPSLEPGVLLSLAAQASPARGASPDRDVVARASVAFDCGGAEPLKFAEAAGPLFVFPRGALSISHELADSECTLCDGGAITLALRNAGRATLKDLIVEEDLGSTRTGLIFKPGSVSVSTDGGASFTPLGPSANPDWRGGILRWTARELPMLAELPAAPIGSGSPQLLIRFGITAGPEAHSREPQPAHSLIARAAGTQPFGTVAEASPDRIRLPIAQPKLVYSQTGRNVTQGAAAGTEVHGGAGDVIEWRIELRNDGNAMARHIRLDDRLSGSGGQVRLAAYEGPGELEAPQDLGGDIPLRLGLPDLPPGGTAVVVLEETLGNTCRSAPNGVASSAARDSDQDGLAASNVPAIASFGCSAVAEAGPNLIAGARENNRVRLSTRPDLGPLRHRFTPLPNARGRIELSVTNDGGTATALVMTDDLPDGLEIDTTVPIETEIRSTTDYATGPGIVGATLGGTTTEPVISFDRTTPADGRGILRQGETLVARFEVIPTTGFDRDSTPFEQPETPGAGDPPAPVGPTDNRVGLAFESTCGGDADAVGTVAQIDLLTPDVDFAAPELASPMLAPGESVEIMLPIVNAGEPGSLADSVTVSVTTGGGLDIQAAEIVDPGGETPAAACAILNPTEVMCAPQKIGPVAAPGLDQAGQAPPVRAVRLVAAALDNGRPIALRARLEADLPTGGGEDVGIDLSLDRIRVPLVGLVARKTLVAPAGSATRGGPEAPTVLVGEEISWDYDLRWFGLDRDERVTDIRLTDRFADGKLDFLGLPVRPGAPARVERQPDTGRPGGLAISQSVLESPGGTLTARASARAIGRSDTGVEDGFGLAFTLDLAEDDARHRVTLGVGRPETNGAPQQVVELRDALSFRVRAPDLAASLTVANTDSVCATDLPFADSVVGDAGDLVTFALSVRNAADAVAAHDVSVVAELPPGLTLLDEAQDELDNDPAGATEGLERLFDLNSGRVVFGSAGKRGSPATPPSATLARLDPGAEVRLYFCARTGDSVALGQVLRARATVTATTGVDAAPSAERDSSDLVRSAEDRSKDAVTVETLAQAAVAVEATTPTVKQIVAAERNTAKTALPATRTDALIGERLRLQLTAVLPAGVAKDLAVVETLDPGLAYVPGSSSLSVGGGLSGCGGGLVADPRRQTLGDGKARLVWSIGTCHARPGGAESSRRLSLSYLLAVEDVPPARHGAVLAAQAAIRVSEGPGASREIPVEQTLIAIREPSLSLSATASSDGGDPTALDAGDGITLDIHLANHSAPDSTAAMSTPGPAEDLTVSLLLPDGLVYVEGTTVGDGFGAPARQGGRLVWGGDGGLSVPANGDRLLSLRLQVDKAVRPGTDLSVPVVVRWSSMPRKPSGDEFGRSADGAVAARNGVSEEAYRASQRVAIGARDATALVKRMETAPAGSEGRYRIGELVGFSLDLALQEGSYDGLSVEDRLPAGMTFHDTVSIEPVSGEAGFDYAMAFTRRKTNGGGAELAVPAMPVAGDTGRLEWRFATLRNSGDGSAGEDRLRIRYRARIDDDVSNLPNQSRLLSKPMRLSGTTAVVRYAAADGPASRSTEPGSDLEIGQPALSMTATRVSPPLFGDNGFHAGEPVGFSLAISNSGTAAAHHVRAIVDLGEGMRATDPGSLPVSMLLLDGRGLPLERGRDFETRFEPEAGSFSISLTDAEDAYIGPGETLGVAFQIAVDPGMGAGKTASSSIRLGGYQSIPDSKTARRYDSDGTSRFTFETPMPGGITQQVLVGGRPDPNNRAAIGEEVTFLLSVPEEPVGASIYDVVIEDKVPLGMKVVRVETNAAELSNADEIVVEGTFATEVSTERTDPTPVDPFVRSDGREIAAPPRKPVWANQQRTRLGDNDVSVTFSRIPPGEQGLVRVIAVPENLNGNTTASTFRNRARYRWSAGPNGDPSDWASSGEPQVVRVAEPDVAVNKTARPPGGLDAGDTVTYTVRVDNIGTVLGAYDFTLRDRLPAEARYVPGSVTFFAGRPLAAPEVVEDEEGHQTLIWRAESGEDGDIDLAPGESIEFAYQAVLNDTVRPGQTLRGRLRVAWSSTNGPNPFERTGTGNPTWNSYFIVDPGDVLIANGGNVTKQVADGPLADGAYRIGDTVPVELRVALSEGTYEGLVIEDELPPGLVFERSDPIRAGQDTAAVSLPDEIEAPRPGAKGVLQWRIGRLVNPGDNQADDELVLRYVARIADDVNALPPPPEAATSDMATAPILRFAGTAADEEIERVGAPVQLAVAQPRLTIDKRIDVDATPPKRPPNEYSGGDTVRFLLTIRNEGAGPAHDVVVRDHLPPALRAQPPELLSDLVRLAGEPVSPAFDGGGAQQSGDIVWRLAGDTSIGPGEELVLAYEVQLDPTVGGGEVLKGAATIESYASLPGGRADGGRVYTQTPVADAPITTPTPTGMTMSVAVGDDPARRRANIGDTVRYRLTVPADPVDVVLYDVVVENQLPTGLSIEPSDVTAVTSTRNARAEDAGITVSGRDVRARFARIPAGEQALVTIDAVVANVPGVGGVARGDAGTTTQIENRSARFRWSRKPLEEGGTLVPVLPTGTDGVPPPTGATAPGVYASTDAVTVTEPRLTLDASIVTDPSPAQAGDRATYRLRVENRGDGRAFDAAVEALLPRGLTVLSARRTEGSTDGVAGDLSPPADLGKSDGRQRLRWTIGDLPEGAVTLVELTLAVTADAEPLERLQADLGVQWTSVSGASPAERTGSGDPVQNDYRRTHSLPSLGVAGPTLVLDTAGEPERGGIPETAGTSHSVGETAAFTAIVRLPRATSRVVRLFHRLDPALQFESATMSGQDVSRPDGTPLPSAVQATPVDDGVVLDLGTLVAQGGAPSVTVVLHARVRDSERARDGAVLTHSATLSMDAPASLVEDVRSRATTDNGRLVFAAQGEPPQITVVEPGPLSLTQTVVADVTPPRGDTDLFFAGDTVRFSLDVTNRGDGPAFAAVLESRLPAGMRRSDPVLVQAVLADTGATVPVNADLTRLASEGIAVWRVAATAGAIPAGATLSLLVDMKLDPQVGAGRDLPVVAQLAGFASGPAQDGNGAARPDVRRYPAGTPVTTTLRVPEPSDIVMTQLAGTRALTGGIPVDAPQSANVGEPVIYTLTVPATPVIASLYDVRIQDRVPEGIRVDEVAIDRAALGDGDIAISGVGDRSGESDPNRIRIGIDRIPAGRQAIVRIAGIVKDRPETGRGSRFENGASFTWAATPGGPAAAPLVTPVPLVLTVAEPKLSLIAGFDPPPDRPVQAGDRLVYRVVVSNDGDGAAHDPEVSLDLDDSLDLADIRPAPDDPGSPTVAEADAGRRLLTWRLGRPLEPGETRRFEAILAVSDRAQMFERMAAETHLSWRSAAGGEAESFSTRAPVVEVPMAGIRFRLAEIEGGTGLYDIGETIEYDAVLTAARGQIGDVRVRLRPDPGLEFVSATVVAEQLERGTGQGGLSVDLVSQPTPETAGPEELEFAFGDLVSRGGTPRLTLRVRLRVRDVPQNRNGAALSVEGRVTLTNPNAVAVDRSDGLYAIPAEGGAVRVALLEPSLAIVGLDRLTEPTVEAGQGRDQRPLFKARDRLRYRMVVRNDGNAPAHNVALRFDLPPGMRADPAVLESAELDGRAVPTEALRQSVPNEGTLQWELPGGLPVPAGKSLTLTIDARIDADVGGAVSLSPAARIVGYHSLPEDRPNERRTYGGGEAVADNISTPVPGGLDVERRVNDQIGAIGANIGDQGEFVLTVPANPVPVALYDVTVSDRLPDGFRIGEVVSSLGQAGDPSGRRSAGRVDVDGQTVRVSFDRLPAGTQAKVSIRGTVRNGPGVRAGMELRDRPEYSWAQGPGGPASPPLGPLRPADPVVVREPRLVVSIDRLPPTVPVDAGDSVSFRVGVRNAGDGPAFGVLMRVLTDPLLQFIEIANVEAAAGAGSNAPGLPRDGGLVGREHDWQWRLGRLGVGEETAFDVAFRVADGIEPRQRLLARVQSLWRSTSVPEADTRDGGGQGAHNDYASITRPLAVDAGLGHRVSVVARGDTLPLDDPQEGGGFRIGDFAEFALTVRIPEGTIKDVVLRDALPAGMTFEDFVPIRAGHDGISFTSPAGDGAPRPGQGGEVSWRLGTVVNPGDNDPDNDTLTLVYRTRVRDTEGVIPTEVPEVEMVNAAQLVYRDARGEPVESVRVSAPILVRQPLPKVALDGPASGALRLTETGGFAVRAVNAGTAPAYGPEVLVRLPEGMRALDPRTLPLRVGIDRGGVQRLEPETDFALEYDGTPTSPLYGLLTVRLAGDRYLAPGETLGVTFQAGFDPGVPDGSTVQILAGLGVYSSRNPAQPPVRTVTRSLDSATGGTPNAGSPDDWADDAILTVRAPTLAVIKAVTDLDGGEAEPGDRLRYTVIIENAGSAAAEKVVLRDVLDGGFAPGSLGDLSVTPSSGRAAADDDGGDAGSGLVLVEDMTIPAARRSGGRTEPGRVTVSYEATLRTVLADRTRISGQARLTVPGYDRPFLSDARDPDMADGEEQGNDPDDPGDDDPTVTVVRARPAMSLTARTSVPEGDVLAPGGRLVVTLQAVNSGTEPLVDGRLSMPMPALAAYVPGSTAVNGETVEDGRGGQAPFAGDGLLVRSPGAPLGRLEVGAPATVAFELAIDTGVPVGARVVGQAWLDGAGEGSGRIRPVRSDDPTTAPTGDPWTRVIGGGPALVATLDLSDVSGPPLVPGDDRLTATLTVANGGDRPALGVTAAIPLPTQLQGLPDTLLFDPDGSGQAPSIRKGRVATKGLSLPIGDIPPGRSVTFTAQLAVGPDAPDRIDVQGHVLAANHAEIGTAPAGGTLRVPVPTPVSLRDKPALTAVQTVEADGPGPVEPGSVLIYTLELANAAAAAGSATDIVLLDQAPALRQGEQRAPLAYLEGSTRVEGHAIDGTAAPLAAGLRLNELGPDVGVLAPGERRVIRYRYRVPQSEAFTAGSMVLAQALLASNGGEVRLAADSGRDDGAEAGNLPDFANDDDPTVAFIGGVVGLGPGHGRTGGVLFVDSDGDGKASAKEARLSGWQVDLLRDGRPLASVKTGRFGDFGFSGLPVGTGYIMIVRHPETATTFAAIGPYGEREREGRVLPGDNAVLGGVPLVSGGAIYDAVTRAPVPGAKVTLLFNDVPVPDTSLMPGQQGQITGSDGLYRFILRSRLPRSNAANLYRIQVDPPEGFASTFPSGLAPPEPFPFDASPGPNPGRGFEYASSNLFPPRGDQAIPYHVTFVLNEGDRPLLNNHVPLDPLAGAQVELSKSIIPSTVAPGEPLAVTISATNLTGGPVRKALREILPPGFAYVPGSARVDGQPREPAVSGRALTWDELPFPPERRLEINFRTRPGASSQDGSYESRSFVLDKASNVRLSNMAVSVLRVAAGTTSVCRDVAGTVFEDRDGNGGPDSGEVGLPGVRILGPGGTTAVTDPNGRFAFGCAELADRANGGAVQLMLDESSLPAGFSAIGRNPQQVVLEGVLTGAVDFPVTQQRVVRLDLADGAFEARSVALKERWADSLDQLMEILREGPSVLRLTYRAGSEPDELIEQRMAGVARKIRELWNRDHGGYSLRIDPQTVRGWAAMRSGASRE